MARLAPIVSPSTCCRWNNSASRGIQNLSPLLPFRSRAQCVYRKPCPDLLGNRIGLGPPSQGWRTFLRNHAPDIAAMDLFVVPMRLDRRDLVLINVITNPWVARQITEVFPWDGAARYMIRDLDRIYGTVVTRRLRAMGIRDKPTAPASPWQNGFAWDPAVHPECPRTIKDERRSHTSGIEPRTRKSNPPLSDFSRC